MEQINTAGGALAVADVMAHEMGHQIQASLNSPVSERGADCLAGVYFASIANGASPRFVGSVDDVRRAAEAAFAVGGEGPAIANSRVAALNTGLTGTADTCLAVYTD
jgi:predicted metalloprotease